MVNSIGPVTSVRLEVVLDSIHLESKVLVSVGGKVNKSKFDFIHGLLFLCTRDIIYIKACNRL